MKRRRFSLDIRPGAVALLAGLYFLLPLRWCVRLALPWWCMSWAMSRRWCCAARRSAVCAWKAAVLYCGARRRRARCARSRRRWQAPPPVRDCFAFCADSDTRCADLSLLYACANLLPVLPLDGGRALHAALTAMAGERAAERTLDVLGLVLPVALMGLGVALFARGMGLAPGVFGAWLALLQPGMTCQGTQHDVKYSYYHM